MCVSVSELGGDWREAKRCVTDVRTKVSTMGTGGVGSFFSFLFISKKRNNRNDGMSVGRNVMTLIQLTDQSTGTNYMRNNPAVCGCGDPVMFGQKIKYLS